MARAPAKTRSPGAASTRKGSAAKPDSARKAGKRGAAATGEVTKRGAGAAKKTGSARKAVKRGAAAPGEVTKRGAGAAKAGKRGAAATREVTKRGAGAAKKTGSARKAGTRDAAATRAVTKTRGAAGEAKRGVASKATKRGAAGKATKRGAPEATKTRGAAATGAKGRAARYPFPFFGAGLAHYFEWGSLYVWFEEPPPRAARAALKRAIPEPFRRAPAWGSFVLHAGSGDQFINLHICVACWKEHVRRLSAASRWC